MYNCLSRGRNLTLHIKSINPQSYPCQGSKMEKITYKQAAELLGCEYMTIRYAVMENRLTRCVSKNRDALLLKDQVQLFVDKPNIHKIPSIRGENIIRGIQKNCRKP